MWVYRNVRKQLELRRRRNSNRFLTCKKTVGVTVQVTVGLRTRRTFRQGYISAHQTIVIFLYLLS